MFLIFNKNVLNLNLVFSKNFIDNLKIKNNFFSLKQQLIISKNFANSLGYSQKNLKKNKIIFSTPNNFDLPTKYFYSTFLKQSPPKPSSNPQDEKFEIFYRLPHIFTLRFLTRLKIYQTITTFLIIPFNFYLYSQNFVTLNSCYFSLFGSLFACLMLYIISIQSQRIIGLAGMRKKDKIVRFSHMNFFGKRNDVYLNLEEIIPFGDLDENRNDLFVKVLSYSNPKFCLYLSLKYGLLLDKNIFAEIFGNK